MADIFVSHTSTDRDWAFWIGQELEKLGHKPRIHEWEISAGGDIAKWMDERLKSADFVLCVVSTVYLTKDYSGWERRAAQWAAQTRRPNFGLPVFVEDCEPPPLLAIVKRCDLYGIGEEEARARLSAYLTPAGKPTEPMLFPGNAASLPPSAKVAFPGGSSVRQPRNLPFTSLGDLFKGRKTALEELRAALMSGKGAAMTGRALHGLGGIGKTRLAIEYAWRHEADYSALLFARADNPATLNANLSALTGAEVLDLPEKEAREDGPKISAVLSWLERHPTWLMILDNVDDEEAVKAVIELTARLDGGHVIVTARATNFPASLPTYELDVLDVATATAFLMDRTHGKRISFRDDEVQAGKLAEELGGLALGLEQAGAYIARQRIGFASYLKLWSEKRESVLKWFDRNLMSYDHDVGLAATWATSVEKLSPESRRLLERLAMLGLNRIPDSLIDLPVPGESAADYDAYAARAGLYDYSLITPAKGEYSVTQGFVMHRLVQEFTRRTMAKERGAAALWEAQEWVRAPFVDRLPLIHPTIQAEASRVRIAQLFLPVFAPLSAEGKFVAQEEISDGAVSSAGESMTLQLTTIEVLVRINVAEMVDPDLLVARELFRRAANIIARIEDAVVFSGLDGPDEVHFIPPGTPKIYRVTGGQKCDGLLKAGDRQPVLLNLRRDAHDGEALVSGVSRAVRHLKRRGQVGPFAIVLGQDLFLIAQTPDLRSSDSPYDRIIPFLGGGLLNRCTALEAGSGVVIALGGAPVQIVRATDMSIEFLHIDAEARFALRVYEKMALRINKNDAVVALRAAESLAWSRGKSG